MDINSRSTCYIRQPEAFSSHAVIRVELDPHVILRGDVWGRNRRATGPVPIQVLVGSNGDPVQTTSVRALNFKVLKTKNTTDFK